MPVVSVGRTEGREVIVVLRGGVGQRPPRHRRDPRRAPGGGRGVLGALLRSAARLPLVAAKRPSVVGSASPTGRNLTWRLPVTGAGGPAG